MFLPNAVRVIANWMVALPAICPLIAGHFLIYFMLISGFSLFTQTEFGGVIIGASCAPITFELLRLVRKNVYPQDVGIISWRTLVFAGLLKSVLNSFVSKFC